MKCPATPGPMSRFYAVGSVLMKDRFLSLRQSSAIGLLAAISITPDSIFFVVVFSQVPMTGLSFFRTVPELVMISTAGITLPEVAGTRRWVGTALSPGCDHRRRFVIVAVPDIVHHTRDLPRV